MTHNSPLYLELVAAHLLLTFYKTDMKEEKRKTEVLTELNPFPQSIFLYSWIIPQVQSLLLLLLLHKIFPISFKRKLAVCLVYFSSCHWLVFILFCSCTSLFLFPCHKWRRFFSSAPYPYVFLCLRDPTTLIRPTCPPCLSLYSLSQLYNINNFFYLKTAPTFGSIYLSNYHSESFSF